MSQPVWGQPQPAPRRGIPTPVIVTLAVVGAVLLLCVVGATAAVIASGDDNPSDASATSSSSPRPGLNAATTPSSAPTGGPAARSTPPTSSAPATAVIPNLVGKNAAVAEDELEKLGFTKVQLGSQDPNDKVVILAANWTVTKQSHKAGTSLTTDTLIVLTCTKRG